MSSRERVANFWVEVTPAPQNERKSAENERGKKMAAFLLTTTQRLAFIEDTLTDGYSFSVDHFSGQEACFTTTTVRVTLEPDQCLVAVDTHNACGSLTFVDSTAGSAKRI